MNTFLRFKKLKNKLLAAFSAFTVIAIGIAAIASYFIHSIQLYNTLHQKAETIHLYGQEAQNATLRFLLEDISDENFIKTGRSAHIDTIQQKIQAIEALLKDQHYQALASQKVINEQSGRITSLLSSYDKTFHTLKTKIQQRGFKNEGLEGRMRETVHSLQEQKDHLDLATVLMMRRHEKDFFLRKDLSYTAKLQETANTLLAQVDNNKSLQEEEKIALQKIVKLYVNNFMQIVEIEKEIGLDDQQGLKAMLHKDIAELNQALISIKQTIAEDCQHLTRLSFIMFGLICFAAVCIGAFLSIYISKAISRPIVLLNQAARAVEQGQTNIGQYLGQISHIDETGQLADSFQAMYNKLNQIIQIESEKAGELKILVEENQKRSWRNEGLNIFAELQRGYAQDLEALCAKAIAELVKYIGANQGVIFLTHEDAAGQTQLSLSACYAYNKKRFVEKTIYPGQGLVGQCYLEKEPVMLTEIPANYVSITSGLGEATPRFLMLVPMLFNEQVMGVIEVASFQVLEAHQADFVKRVAFTLAGSIAAVKTNEQTKALLEEAKKRSEALALKEEILQQSLEELQAMQEFRVYQQEEV